MKKIIFIAAMTFLLMACGNSSGVYDSVIDGVISSYKSDVALMMLEDKGNIVRENAEVSIYEEGRYVKIAFFDPLEEVDQKLYYAYFEKRGDAYMKMKNADAEDILMGKEPDYVEQLGKEI